MPFDFSTNKTVEELSSVPEDFKSFFQETTDGSGFSLSEDQRVKDAVKVISGLWSTVSNQRKELDTNVETGLKEALSPLSDFGDSAESILEAIAARVEEAKKSGKTDKDVDAATDKLRKDLTDVHEAEKRNWTDEKGSLVGQIRGLLVDNVINEALGDRAVSSMVARRVIADFVDIDSDENGKFRTIVKDPDNPKQARKNVTDGQLFKVEDLIKELSGKDDYKPLFKSEAPKGSGSQPGAPSRRVDIPVPGEKKSSYNKIRDGLKKREKQGT